jgi:DNA-binding beta-propeller fold protein YncE
MKMNANQHSGVEVRDSAGRENQRCILRALALLGFALVLTITPAHSTEFQISLGGFSGEGELERPGAIFYETALGEIYIADVGHTRIAVYDSIGSYLADIPILSATGGSRDRLEPCAVAVDRQGRVFVATNQETSIRVYDPRGSLLTTIHSPETVDPSPYPRILFVDSRDQLHAFWFGATEPWTVFGPDLTLSWKGASFGSEPSQFVTPTAMCVEAGGRAYFCDGQSLPAVKVFDADHQYLFGFGGHDISHDDFSVPSGIATTGDGSIWVSDRQRQVIKRFDSQGRFLTMIGGWGQEPGELRYPAGLAADSRNWVMVTESGGARFQIYTIPSDSASSGPGSAGP